MPLKKLPAAIVRFKDRINTFQQNDLLPTVNQLHNDITHFSHSQLKPLPVYFANTNIQRRSTFIPYHGFLVSGVVDPKGARECGRVYSFVIDIMKTPFSITPALLKELTKYNYPPRIQMIMHLLEGETFPTPEDFLRTLIAYDVSQDPDLFIPSMISNIYDPIDAVRELILLNFQENKPTACYKPTLVNTKINDEELRLYTRGHCITTKLPLNHLSLIETLHEQTLYFDYLDQRLGLGKTISEEEKNVQREKLSSAEREQLLHRWVQHHEFPKGEREANCNASIASLYQYAKNREEGKSTLTFQPIPSTTLFAVAKNHRMHMHDPLVYQECLDALQAYLYKRRRYGDRFWGRLFNLTKEVKENAVLKMIDKLQKKECDDFFSEELVALRQGKLGKIVLHFPHTREVLERESKRLRL